MKRGWVYILLVVLVACSQDEVPEQYLSEDEMAQVLLDIYIAEGMLSFKNLRTPSSDIYEVYKEQILQKHGLTDSVYKENMSFYVTNPEHMDRVYEIVIDSLKLRRQALPGESPF